MCKVPRIYMMHGGEVQQGNYADEVFILFYYYLVEGVVAVEDQQCVEYVGNLEISIHAISGTPTPNTMRIVGIIQHQRVVILVDSESTHNFLDPSVVKRTRISRIFKQVIKVIMANGKEMLSESKCIDVCLKLQGNTLCLEFLCLP